MCEVTAMKNRWRYRNSWMDFKGDGRFKRERIKGADKRKLRKKTIKLFWKEKQREVLYGFE